MEEMDSFCKRGLSQVGTLIATSKTCLLIGDITKFGGHGDCEKLKPETIVEEYRVLPHFEKG